MHILRNRDLLLLLSASFISLTGDWILSAGLTYQIYARTGSTVASAAMVLATLLPQLVLGSFAGVLADRWDRRRLMIGANLSLSVVLLPLLGDTQTLLVYAVAATQSAVATFFTAAEAALVPSLVPESGRVTANALNGQVRDVARLAGAALGGVLAATGGIRLIALADIATFAVAAALLTLIRHRVVLSAPPLVRPSRFSPVRFSPLSLARLSPLWLGRFSPLSLGRLSPLLFARLSPVLQDWRAGLRLATSDRTLRTLLAFVLITGVGEAIMMALMAPFVRDVLHGGPEAYGTIMSVQAVGGLAGGLLTTLVAHRIPPRLMLGGGAIAFGLLDLVLFLYPLAVPALWPAVVIMIVVGLPGALSLAGLVTVFQTATEDSYRGRVFGALTALRAAAMLGGLALAGAAGSLGIVPVIAVQGAGFALAGLLVLIALRSPATTPRPVTSPPLPTPAAH